MIAALAPSCTAFRGVSLARNANTQQRVAARRPVRLAPVRAEKNDYSSANDEKAKDPSINPAQWTRTQEVSNGRAAIAGLISAFIAEKVVGTSAFDQLFGSSPGYPWAKPLFFAVVLFFIAVTSSERFGTDRQPISGNPQASPFPPELRLNAGRAAMVGFAALMVYEKLYNTAFFA